MPYATKRWRTEHGDRFWYVDVYGTVRMARAGAQPIKSPYGLIILDLPEPEPDQAK